jgi:hypothetical protein
MILGDASQEIKEKTAPELRWQERQAAPGPGSGNGSSLTAGLLGSRRAFHTNEQSNDNFCHSERSEESLSRSRRDSSLRYAPFRMT